MRMPTLLQKLVTTENSRELLRINIRRLMQEKGINEADLARNAELPAATLHKILSGKTEDPRASTLTALANYFRISVDELLTGIVATKPISEDMNTSVQSYPVLTWHECINVPNILNTLTVSNWEKWIAGKAISKKAYALTSKPSMEPYFLNGTMLIIDLTITAKDGDIVVVHYPSTNEATIRKLISDGPTIRLQSLNLSEPPSNLNEEIKFLGALSYTMFMYN